MLINQFIFIAQVLGWMNVILLTIFIFLNSFSPANNPDVLKTTSRKKLKKRLFRPLEIYQSGLTFGMTKNEVLGKPGKLIIKNSNSFYHVLSENEQADIHFDKTQQVKVISLTFLGKNGKNSKFTDVFAEKSPRPQQSNSIDFYLFKFAGKGCSFSYYCLGGDPAVMTNTMGKLPNTEIFGH